MKHINNVPKASVLALLSCFLTLTVSTNEVQTGQEGNSSISVKSPYRLPQSIHPEHYLIRLQPFIDGNFSIHGYTEITFQVTEPTSVVSLHIRDILTKNETLKIYDLLSGPSSSLLVSNQTYDKELEFYTITMNETLKKGTYVMQLDFIGYLNDKLDGFYRSSYTDRDGNKRWLAITQMQPTDARMAFPCFDEPALKAEFSIELVRQEGRTSISNMPLKETMPLTDQPGWFVDKFDKFVKTSTYLVAFMISDFEFVEFNSPGNGTAMRVWSRENVINQTDYALEKGMDLLLFFENFFNITFPLPKMDMVALPDFSAGAMENWGLITYREAYLIYDPEHSSINNKKVVGGIIAHEMAHQWFGNLVTPSWWTDLWLNEGFATYLSIVGLDYIEPSFKALELFVLGKLRDALLSDSYENSHAISIPVGHPSEISEIFDAISYFKGASIIRMMSNFLTEETFKKSLTNFLNKFAYSDATQDDLWHSMTLEAQMDNSLPLNVTVKEIMDTWTLQMGFPVVTVIRHSNGSATLSQEKYRYPSSKNFSDNHDYKWWIPVSFTTQENPNFTNTFPEHWISPDESKEISGLPSNDKWVIFNVQQTGFYRVNYELKDWNLLIQQLVNNHSAIGPMNRAQIIGDAFQLAKAGFLPYRIPLDLGSYLINETEYVPLLNGFKEIEDLDRRLKYTDHYEVFKTYVLSLLSPHYEKLGFEEELQDSYIDITKRSQIRGRVCYYGHEHCVQMAVRLFRDWMNNTLDGNPILPNLRSLVYTNAIKEGGNEEWEFAWQQYLHSDATQEKMKLLRALGKTKNSTRKLMLLNSTFKPDGPIRKNSASSTFKSIITDRESSLLAWNYLTENWERIVEYMGTKRRSIFLLNSAIGHVRTLQELEERDKFIATKKLLSEKGTRSLHKTRERIVETISWLDNMKPVSDWLYSFNATKSAET